MAHDGAFEYRFVLQKTVLDLRRRDKDATDFQHVVRASVIPIIAFGIDMKLITGRAPIAGKSLFRFLMCVPVTQGR